MPNLNEDKITNYVTKTVAEEWNMDAEKTLFFVEVLAQLDINLTLRKSPDSFDALQNHFETICETTLTIKELIKEFVDDHKKHFDCYPMDVEVNEVVYSWEQYWSILGKSEFI
jgi:hypothetical protein|tara:strand:- start:413 stop:751 length:339 start_codon:yes stop_codon:yes gene_type:complete